MTDAIYGCDKVEETFWFYDLFFRQCIWNIPECPPGSDPFRNYLYEVEVFRIIIIFHESILCYSVKVYVKGKISVVVQFEIKIVFGVL